MKRLFHTVRDGLFIISRDGVVRFGNEAAMCLIPCAIDAPIPNPGVQRMIAAASSGHMRLPYAVDIELGEDCLVAAADTIRAHLIPSPVGTDYVVILHNLTEDSFYGSAIDNLAEMVDRECGAGLERFRAGLAGLLARIDALGDRHLELGEQVEALMNDGENLLAMLRRLSDLARLTGDAPIVGDERIQVLDWVAGCVDAVRPAANLRGMAVVIEQPAQELPPVYGSTAWLERAFSELLDNAIKYGPPRSNVAVTFKQNGNFMLISVANVGDQIPAHLRHRLFQAFYRGRNAAGGVPGLGLGLNLCRQIMQMHGGNVVVGDSGAGKTDFTVELPTGAPSRENPHLDIVQAQRYAQDLARLMARRSRKPEGVEQ